MKRLLFLLLVGILFPTLSWAAAGDDCRADVDTGNSIKGGLHCKVLYDWASDADGTLVAAPATFNICWTKVVVTRLTGGTPNYDNWRLMGYTESATGTGVTAHNIAAFDNDGAVTAGFCPGDVAATGCGLTYKEFQGNPFPYYQFDAGTTTDLTDMVVSIIQWECGSNP